MRQLPYFADPDTREDILEHISGFAFDRALTRSDEPMRAPRYRAEPAYFPAYPGDLPRKRSVRR